MSENKEMISYLKQCPEIKKIFPLFGEVKGKSEMHLFRSPDGYKVQRQYVDGGKAAQRYSDYNLLIFDTATYMYQPENKSENLTDYESAQTICNWIAEQRLNHIFPKFEDTVTDIECIPSNPQIAGVDDNNIAKYMINIRITFEMKYYG